MTQRRHISWTAAVRDMRNDRFQVSPADRCISSAARAFAKLAADRARLSSRVSPFVVAGAYDRSAIMRAAIVAAKARRTVTGEAWGVCLSGALKGTWQVAQAARRASAH